MIPCLSDQNQKIENVVKETGSLINSVITGTEMVWSIVASIDVASSVPLCKSIVSLLPVRISIDTQHTIYFTNLVVDKSEKTWRRTI